ncbi:acyltransferase [Aureitalea marina]|uniref:Acyltransferase 3 domain-containing protein n=1 Tax=Aureitalea marina TaxID=930804 RepID=A0A2S7KNN0_9FLAO|nr:acyltransferase family protein [Aureitalea marina]PQB04234.1 hypothetical protein BST85_04440 [Aureitalea marina]
MITYINILRVLAGIFVVLLHVSGDGFDLDLETYNKGSMNWWVTNAYNSITRWTVPIFVMMGGALAIRPKNQRMTNYILKRSKRVLVPLLFWALIYLGYRIGFNGLSIDRAFYQFFISGKPFYHLWYFYMLLGLTILTPVLSLIREKYGEWFVGLVGLVLLILFLTVPASHDVFPLVRVESVPAYLVWFMPYLGYYCLGSYFANMKNRIKPMLIVLLLLILWTVTIIGVYYADRIFHSYLAWNTAGISILIFVLFKQMNFASGISKISTKLAPLTLGVYLMHPLLLELLKGHRYNNRLDKPHIGNSNDHTLLLVDLSIIHAIILKTQTAVTGGCIAKLSRLV